MTAIDLVLFDMDGVLADTEPLHLEAANLVLSAEGAHLSEEAVKEFLGNTDDRMFDVLKARFALTRPTSHYVDRKLRTLLNLLENDPVVANPGVHELVLKLVMRGVDRVVASSSPPELIEAIVSTLGLRRSFSGLYSARQVGRGKPAPDLFLHAARSRGISPMNCLVIEDAPNGIEAARSAGMRVVAVRTETTRGLDLSRADRVLDSLVEFDCEEFFDGR